MKRGPPLSPKNTTGAPERAASGLSKKARSSHTSSSGAADHEPPPKDVAPRDEPEKKDVEMTRSDTRPTVLVDVKMEPVGAKDEAEEVTEDDADEAWAAAGFRSNRDVVEATVAEAVAEVAKINAPKKKQNEDALEALPALEEKVGKGLKKTECTDFCTKWGLPQQPGGKDKIPKKLRALLEKEQKEMVVQQKLDGEGAVLETTLRLEMKLFEALPEDDKEGVIGWRSLQACASLMAEASSELLKCCKDGESGNVDRLIIGMRKANVELMSIVDGEHLENTNKNKVLRVICSLQNALDALPPKDVAAAVIDRLKLLKHAPRANKAACAALEADLTSRARSYAAQDAASAKKVTLDLGPLPLRNAAAVAERDREYKKWTAAPPAERAAVWSGVKCDSYALGTEAALQQWPEWLDRPTIVADPRTVIEGVELGTIKEMDVLAKSLATGERNVQGKLRKQQGDAAEETGEEESG